MRKNIFKIWTMFILALFSQEMWSQSFTQLEYWFDGQFSARKTKALSGKEASVSMDISTEGLTLGLHRLHFRTKKTDGTYSSISSSYFFKTNQAEANKIEYWFDDDYAHHATKSTTSADKDISISTLLQMGGSSSFPEGFHRFNFRVTDANGSYSAVQNSYVINFGKFASTAKLEYWFDDDYDKRAYREANATESVVSIDELLDLNNHEQFPLGYHCLNYRFVTAQSCLTSIQTFAILNVGNFNTNCKLEYWLDNDYENRAYRDLNASESVINIDDLLDFSNIEQYPLGMHRLNYRLLTSAAGLSPVCTAYFMNKGNGGEPCMIEYWLDNDIAHSKLIKGAKTEDGQYSIVGNLSFANASKGLHRLNYRATTAQGAHSAVHTNILMYNGIAGAPDRLEYWLDDDVEHMKYIDGKLTKDGSYLIAGELDMSDVEMGAYRLHYRATSQAGANYSGTSVSHIFVMGGEMPTLQYWFDDDMEHSSYIETTQYGNVFLLDDLIDASKQTVGMHVLNYKLTSEHNRFGSAVNSATILVMPRENFFNRQDETTIVSGIYWVDDKEAKQFENFVPGETIDLEELINLADLEDGKHVFSMRFVDSNGKWTDVDKTVFKKMVVNGTQIIAGIIYKYVENADEAPYAAAIGYNEDMVKAEIQSTVQFGGDDYEVKAIDASAFYGAKDIDEIANIPSTVKAIGEKAFAGASINEVNLNAAVAPTIGQNAFPAGTNLRVPIGATGYSKTTLAKQNVTLTYDLGCIYDAEWNALKQIDAMVRAQGSRTGWDFTDRTATPAGISRLGTDHVLSIDLSNHDLKGAYESTKWSEGLPKLTSIDLSGNSITDMINAEGYGVLKLDAQKYNNVLEVRIDQPDVDALLTPEVPLIFRDANSGAIGNAYNQTIAYRLSTKAPDESYMGEWQEEYCIILTVAPNGTIKMVQNQGNKTNIYREKSGQELSLTASGIHTITPGTYIKMRLYFGDGDVNLDGFADVTDLQKVINYIFEYGSTSHIFAWHAANLADDDDIINVQDVVGVVDVLLHQTPEDMAQADETISSRRRTIALLENVEYDEEEETTALISISDEGLAISCDEEVAALDLVVDKGIDFSELKRMGFVISHASLGDGREHIVAYSLSGAVIPVGEHIIGKGTAGKTISAATLADIESNRIHAVINNGATGIEIATEDAEDGLRYDLSGRITNKGYRGITIQKGQVRYSNKSK